MLAPGTARRQRARRGDRRDRGRAQGAVLRLARPLRAHARTRARPHRASAAPRLRHGAAPPSDRRARGDADRADRRQPGGRRERERPPNGNGAVAEEALDEEDEDEPAGGRGRGAGDRPPTLDDPGAARRFRFRHPTASGKTIAAAGFVEAARSLGVLILTHRRLLVSQFTSDLTTEGYGKRFTDAVLKGQKPEAARPDHDPDVRVVRAPRRRHRPRRVPARHLRRGAHRARREDERGDPLVPRADLHRHDRDRAADREAGRGRLPGLGRRPAADRRRAPRVDRAAALPARPAGRGDPLGADRRRRLRGEAHWPPSSTTRP